MVICTLYIPDGNTNNSICKKSVFTELMESPIVEYNEIRNCGRKIAEISPATSATPNESFNPSMYTSIVNNPIVIPFAK